MIHSALFLEARQYEIECIWHIRIESVDQIDRVDFSKREFLWNCSILVFVECDSSRGEMQMVQRDNLGILRGDHFQLSNRKAVNLIGILAILAILAGCLANELVGRF